MLTYDIAVTATLFIKNENGLPKTKDICKIFSVLTDTPENIGLTFSHAIHEMKAYLKRYNRQPYLGYEIVKTETVTVY